MTLSTPITLSEKEQHATSAVLHLATRYALSQAEQAARKEAGLPSAPVAAQHLEELQQNLDRAVHALVVAAREPLEQRLDEQDRKIGKLQEAVEALKRAI